ASDPPAPGDRWQLARSESNLAMLLRAAGRNDEAEDVCRDALKLLKGLRADFPNVPDYRHELAALLNNFGLLQRDAKPLQEAELVSQEALETQEARGAAAPRRPDSRQALAVSRLNLASVLEPIDTRRAARTYRDVLAIQERLTAEFPEVPEYQSVLGRTL